MKECPRCKITFHLDDRARCLYCDTLLSEVSEDKTDLKRGMERGLELVDSRPLVQQIIKDRGIGTSTRLQFIVASYFRTRTLHFMYAFSRNEFKMGPDFKRELIQPFNLTALLTLPWLVWNILDSFFFRVLYTKYCPKCGWKFYKQERTGEHNHEECDYNREYKEVVSSVLSGEILKEESTFRRLGLMKRSAGRKSAYWDLCEGSRFFSSFLDVVTIWFSICLWITLAVVLLFPSVLQFVYTLEV